MNGLLEAATEVSDFMRSQRWQFCIIGGLAVQRWGEPRTTLDADFTLIANWGEESPYVDTMLARFQSRKSDAREFALKHRVLLIRGANGTPVDVSLGALPFEMEMVQRAVDVEFTPNVTLRCCTAEDLFVMKAFASRPRDWLDVESIAKRQKNLDSTYILKHLREFSELKDDPNMLMRVESMMANRG